MKVDFRVCCGSHEDFFFRFNVFNYFFWLLLFFGFILILLFSFLFLIPFLKVDEVIILFLIEFEPDWLIGVEVVLPDLVVLIVVDLCVVDHLNVLDGSIEVGKVVNCFGLFPIGVDYLPEGIQYLHFVLKMLPPVVVEYPLF